MSISTTCKETKENVLSLLLLVSLYGEHICVTGASGLRFTRDMNELSGSEEREAAIAFTDSHQ